MYCGRPGASPSTPQSMGLALPGGFKPFSQPPPPPPPPSTSPPSVEPTPTELSAPPPLDLILQSPIGPLFPKGKCHEGRGSDPPRVAPLNPPLHTHTHNPDVRLPINSHSVHGGGQRERAYARHGNEAVHQEGRSGAFPRGFDKVLVATMQRSRSLPVLPHLTSIPMHFG